MREAVVSVPKPLQDAWNLWALQIANALFPWVLMSKKEQSVIKSAQQFLDDAIRGLNHERFDASDECFFQSNADYITQCVFGTRGESNRAKIVKELRGFIKIISGLIENPKFSISEDTRKKLTDLFQDIAKKGGNSETKWRLEELGFISVRRN